MSFINFYISCINISDMKRFIMSAWVELLFDICLQSALTHVADRFTKCN